MMMILVPCINFEGFSYKITALFLKKWLYHPMQKSPDLSLFQLGQ